MRKFIAPTIAAIGAALLVVSMATAQPGIGITKTAPLSGSGSTANPLKITVCAAGQVYAVNAGGTAWECTTPSVGTGDITGVTVTNPACSAGSFVATLTGGASTGDAPIGGGCVAEVGDISTVTATANMGLTGGGTSGAVTLGLLSTCADGQVLKAGGTGTTWTCANDTGGTSYTAGNGLALTVADFSVNTGTGITITADAVTANLTGASCSAGNYMSALGATGTGTCTAEVGDISSVVAGTGLVTGATSGAATVDVACGTGLTCNANDVTLNMTAQSCSAGSHISAATATGVFTCTADSGGAYTAGDGLTLTASDFDLTYTSDFTITSDQLDLSTAVTAPGTLTTAGNTTRGDAVSDAHIDNGQLTINGTTYASIFNLTGGTEHVYIRGGKATSQIVVGDANTGGVFIGSLTNISQFVGAVIMASTLNVIGAVDLDTTLNVDGTATILGNTVLGNATTDTVSSAGPVTVNHSISTTGGNGNLNISREAYFGSLGQVYLAANEAISLNFGYNYNSEQTGLINDKGYIQGTTQFRNLEIRDGKSAAIATFTGSTKAVAFAASITVADNITAGNADSDVLTSRAGLGFTGTDVSVNSGNCTVAGEAQAFTITSNGDMSSCIIQLNRTLSGARCVFSAATSGAAAAIASPGMYGSTGSSTQFTLTMVSGTVLTANKWEVLCFGDFD